MRNMVYHSFISTIYPILYCEIPISKSDLYFDFLFITSLQMRHPHHIFGYLCFLLFGANCAQHISERVFLNNLNYKQLIGLYI